MLVLRGKNKMKQTKTTERILLVFGAIIAMSILGYAGIPEELEEVTNSGINWTILLYNESAGGWTQPVHTLEIMENVKDTNTKSTAPIVGNIDLSYLGPTSWKDNGDGTQTPLEWGLINFDADIDNGFIIEESGQTTTGFFNKTATLLGDTDSADADLGQLLLYSDGGENCQYGATNGCSGSGATKGWRNVYVQNITKSWLNLAYLNDTEGLAPSDGDVLTYSSSTQKWTASAPTGGSSETPIANTTTNTLKNNLQVQDKTLNFTTGNMKFNLAGTDYTTFGTNGGFFGFDAYNASGTLGGFYSPASGATKWYIGYGSSVGIKFSIGEGTSLPNSITAEWWAPGGGSTKYWEMYAGNSTGTNRIRDFTIKNKASGPAGTGGGSLQLIPLANFPVNITDVLAIAPRSGAPTGASLGWIYVDSDTSELCMYNGTAWNGAIYGGTCA